MELEVLDLVRIDRSDGYVYFESVNVVKPQPNGIYETDHFHIKTDTLEVISDFGYYDDMTYKLKQVWRKENLNQNYILIWENGKEVEEIENEKTCQCDDRTHDIPYEQYMKVCKERDKLNEVVIFQAKVICDLHHALEFKGE
jgi:hypothetical protein